MKYLTKSYIIKCIFQELFTFLLNNFHWVCYIVMILNHIMTASFLTLFYPISIFCYAILEYPRPPRIYWKICLLYSVFLLVIKFIFHLEFLRKSDSFTELITNLYNYKCGIKIYDSSVSREFLIYMIYDALVLIFLLINDYLLVSRGIWSKREQEIENIYQANERIAKSSYLPKTGLDENEVKKFNDSFFLQRELTISNDEDKKKYRFNTLLITDAQSKEEKSKKEEGDNLLKKTQHLKTLIEKSNLRLSSIKTNESIINKKEEEQKIKQKIEKFEKKIIEIDQEIKDIEKYDEASRSYCQRLFPKVRNEKPGNEFYGWYTTTMALIIVFIVIFYTTMVQDKTFGSIELDTNQFSGEMVIVLLIHVAILLYDRVLYISQNRGNLKYEHIFYDKATGDLVPESEIKNYSITDGIIPPDTVDKLNKKYNIVNIQNEEFNCTEFQKYLLHMVITIISHLFIFFYCPMIGNYNTYGLVYCENTGKNNDSGRDEASEDDDEDSGEQCNDFLYNKALICFYLLYVIYYISSGLQVRYGFYDMKRKSMLKSGDKSLNGTIYNVYKAIPFLYEIKLAIDWTFTKTCLDLFQWNKFESVYDIVYVTFCAMNAKNSQLVGQKVGKFMKIVMGGVLAFLLIVILIAPLMLFSNLNPTNKLNNLTGAVLKIDLCFFYKNKAVKNYTLYENSRPSSIENIEKSGRDWDIYNYSLSSKTKNFEKEQIQTVQFFEESDKNWDLTTPLIENLKHLILNRKNISDLEYISLAIDYNFDRPLPIESNKINKRYIYTIYYYDNYTNTPEYEYIEQLGEALNNCHDTEITYKNVYSPPIRLSSNIKPKRLTDKKYFPNLDIKLGFVGCKVLGNDKNFSYLESYFTLKKIMNITDEATKKNITIEEGVKFHVFSDKVSSTTSGTNVLTFYISFVLLIGNYVRNFFAGQPEKIMLTEMPYSERIINLCEGIKISRNSYDFEKEEKYYYTLIEFMRSPGFLRKLTESSREQFRRREEMTRANKTSDDI